MRLALFRILLVRESKKVFFQSGNWWILAGYLFAVGLFLLLRLAAGEGGDYGGYFREVGSVLLLASALLGARSKLPYASRELYLAGPFHALEVVFARVLPVLGMSALLAILGGFLPGASAPFAPVPWDVLGAGALSLVPIGSASCALGAAAGAFFENVGAGALVGFLLAFSLWGANGLSVALGFPWLAHCSLSAGLALAGAGWVSVQAASVSVLCVGLSLLVLRTLQVTARL